MDACAQVRAALADLLDGGELADPAGIDHHLAACGSCREVCGELLRLHRLLLEASAADISGRQRSSLVRPANRPGASKGRLPDSDGERQTATRSRRVTRRRQSGVRTQRRVLAAVGMLALVILVLVGLSWRPSGNGSSSMIAEAEVQTEPVVTSNDGSPWPWLQLRASPDSSVAYQVHADGLHEVQLEHGRVHLETDPRARPTAVVLRLGQHRAWLLGTTVSAWSSGEGGWLAVRHGAARIGNHEIRAGQEVLTWGSQVLPPLAVQPAQAAAQDADLTQPPHHLLMAEDFRCIGSNIELQPEAGIAGSVLVGTRTEPGGRAAVLANPIADARAMLSLPPGSSWRLQILCRASEDRQLGFHTFSSASLAHRGGDLVLATPSSDRPWQWLPADGGGELLLRASPDDASASTTAIELVGYHRGFTIAAVLLRPQVAEAE